MAQKNFVLDTNVLLHDPEALFKFPGHCVVIPMPVIEELDRMKGFRDELGKNSRATMQLLDGIKAQFKGDLHKGVEIENGSTVRVQPETKPETIPGLSWSSNDNKIILIGWMLQERGEQVVFLSKNFASRVKANAIGLKAEDYRALRASFDEITKGVPQVEVEKREIDALFKDGEVAARPEVVEELAANTYCLLRSGAETSLPARYLVKEGIFERLRELPQDLWGIQPLNVEQKCALDLLLREDIPLVTLLGPAGTGKTLLALASALRKVFDEGRYSRLLVSRPIMPLGRDIGYLPGTKEEKLYHWMQPIHDNLEVLCESSGGEPTDTLRWVVDSPKFEMEAVTYIRGRTLPNTYMIIDEAQNLTPHEVKTIVSRAGHKTKVILTGDPSQIDNPYLDKDSNGLTYAWSRMADYRLFGHIYLEKTERSELAALAAEVL